MRLPSSVDEILAIPDPRNFVETAYRVLLGREADPAGAWEYLGHLQSRRLTKSDVLAVLRLSEEGRERRLRLAGLRNLVTIYQIRTALRKTRWGSALVGGRDEVEDGEPSRESGLTREDVIAAFQLAFHRVPESEEAIAHQLLTHRSLDSLMADFFKSPEFRRQNLEVIKLLNSRSRERLKESAADRFP